MRKLRRLLIGTWPSDDLRRAFVAGAKWWAFEASGVTLFASEVDRAEQEANRRYGNVAADEVAQLRADLASVRQERDDAQRIVKSIAAMLGWINVPPQHMLEGDIRALKARVADLAAPSADQEPSKEGR